MKKVIYSIVIIAVMSITLAGCGGSGSSSGGGGKNVTQSCVREIPYTDSVGVPVMDLENTCDFRISVGVPFHTIGCINSLCIYTLSKGEKVTSARRNGRYIACRLPSTAQMRGNIIDFKLFCS